MPGGASSLIAQIAVPINTATAMIAVTVMRALRTMDAPSRSRAAPRGGS